MRFSIRDLLLVTVVAAIGVWVILFLRQTFDVPNFVSLATGLPLVGAVAGMLIGKFRGGIIGILIGGGLAFVSMLAYFTCLSL